MALLSVSLVSGMTEGLPCVASAGAMTLSAVCGGLGPGVLLPLLAMPCAITAHLSRAMHTRCRAGRPTLFAYWGTDVAACNFMLQHYCHYSCIMQREPALYQRLNRTSWGQVCTVASAAAMLETPT